MVTRIHRRRAFGVVAASALLALVGSAAFLPIGPAASADGAMMREDVYTDIEKTLGSVPAFVRQLPQAALAGAWQEEKDLELSDRTALPPKVKALISLAVAAQILCTYCIWADTNAARQFGATDEEIGEAVAWLCSDRASYVTGLPMPVDGGFMAT